MREEFFNSRFLALAALEVTCSVLAGLLVVWGLGQLIGFGFPAVPVAGLVGAASGANIARRRRAALRSDAGGS